jgi:hypothetical protein
VGYWGWTQHDGWLRFILVAGLPILVAVIWGVFAVPNDPGRSGKTVVATQGWIRLILELTIFGCATWAFFDSGHPIVGMIFGIVVILHYITYYDRLKWLLKLK